MKKYTMVEIFADDGASEILSAKDFGKEAMTEKQFTDSIYEKYGKNGISEIIFS